MRRTSGISLMLLIFLSLCLITFSLLSLSGAVADEKLSQKAADHTSEYYQADEAANGLLSQIDSQLAVYLKTAEKSQQPKTTYMKLCAGISDDIPEALWTPADAGDKTAESGASETGVISFTILISDTQELQAELEIAYPEDADDTLYQIASWKTVNTADWNADTSQHVFRQSNVPETEIKE